MRFRTFAAAAILCLLAAGCGGSKQAKPPPSTHAKYVPVVPDKISEGTGACALLTQGEVAAAVGLPADAGGGTRSGAGESCTWALRASGHQFVGVLALDSGGSSYEQKLASAPKGVEPLTGLGDRAFAINDSVWVVKGERLVTVQVVTSQPVATRKQQAVALAQTAISRR